MNMNFLKKKQSNLFNFKAVVRYLIEFQVAEIKTYTVKGISFRASKAELDRIAVDHSKNEGFTNYEIAVLRSGKWG